VFTHPDNFLDYTRWLYILPNFAATDLMVFSLGSHSYSSFRIAWSVFALLVDIPIYVGLYAYFDAVFPSNYGIK
jgi:hypothetical protein